MKCEDVFLFCQELVLKCSGSLPDPEHVPIMYSHSYTELVKSCSGCRALWQAAPVSPTTDYPKVQTETQQRTNHSQSREWDMKAIIQPPSWQSWMSQWSCGTLSMEQELLWVVKCILPQQNCLSLQQGLSTVGPGSSREHQTPACVWKLKSPDKVTLI